MPKNRRRGFAGWIVCLFSFTPALWAQNPAAQPLCGRLSEHQGLPVLEVWGTPEQAGYAHGYLMAEPLVRLFDDFVLSPVMLESAEAYETLVRPGVRRAFVWTEAQEREMKAICAGVRDRLGEANVRSRRLGRALDVEDLMVVNTLADLRGALCSSFSAWGTLTADGQPLTARNLDYPAAGGMERAQLILVHHGDGQHVPWIAVTWPGLIGVYTAMNREGVTLTIHDAWGLPASHAAGFTPRALGLRDALEAAKAATFLDDVRRVFEQRRVMVGNNIHASAPLAPHRPPAAIFEYDANRRDGGVTVRFADPKEPRVTSDAKTKTKRKGAEDKKGGPRAANGTAGNADAGEPATSLDFVCCTNHLRVRREPRNCERYGKLTAALAELAQSGKKLDPAAAIQLIHSVRQRTTLHTVCFAPGRKMMYVHIPALQNKVVEFHAEEWLSRPIGPAAAPPVGTKTP